jgi:hypothetical protein
MGYLVKALEDQIAEHEKRLSLVRESVQYIDPVTLAPKTISIFDGGSALTSPDKI